MSELWAVGLAEGLAKSNSLASFSLNLNNQGDMSELWAVGLAEGLAKSNSFRSFSSNFNNQVDMSELWGLGLAKSNSLWSFTTNATMTCLNFGEESFLKAGRKSSHWSDNQLTEISEPWRKGQSGSSSSSGYKLGNQQTWLTLEE